MSFYPDYITVAASDSPAWARGIADYVCQGDGDGVTLNRAIERAADDGKNLYIFDGRYVIDSFYDPQDGGPLCALCVPRLGREFRIVGQSFAASKAGGVQIYVTAGALDAISDEDVSVIRTAWAERGIGNRTALRMENVRIALSHNRAALRCIDLRRCDRPELKNVNLSAIEDMGAGLGNPPPIAKEGCIGITMTDGSNQAFSNYFNVLACGFYEGIQVAVNT